MSEPCIYDLKRPDWTDANDDGVWCSFCGELLVVEFHLDENTVCPDFCRTCGAPDPEDMAEYFA